MKIAINYLGEVINLIKENKIKLDYIKYPSISDTNLKELEDIMNENNIHMLFHGMVQKNHYSTNIASDTFVDDIDIKASKEAVKISKTPGLSMHIGDSQEGYDNIHTKNELLEIIYKNIKYLKENFPNMDFYSLENKENPLNKVLIDPTFITDCINYTKCDFLLDISHAAIASKNIGMDFYEYLSKLPLDKIYEIHINGWEYDKNGNAISHIKINEEGYKALEYVLKRSNTKIVTIEYGAFLEGKKLTYIKNFKEESFEVRNEVLEQINRIKNICL